jgi:hypothetical protein
MPVAGGSSGTRHNTEWNLCGNYVSWRLSVRIDRDADPKRIEDQPFLRPTEAGEVAGDPPRPLGDVVKRGLILSPCIAAREDRLLIALQLLTLQTQG